MKVRSYGKGDEKALQRIERDYERKIELGLRPQLIHNLDIPSGARDRLIVAGSLEGMAEVVEYKETLVMNILSRLDFSFDSEANIKLQGTTAYLWRMESFRRGAGRAMIEYMKEQYEGILCTPLKDCTAFYEKLEFCDTGLRSEAMRSPLYIWQTKKIIY